MIGHRTEAKRLQGQSLCLDREARPCRRGGNTRHARNGIYSCTGGGRGQGWGSEQEYVARRDTCSRRGFAWGAAWAHGWAWGIAGACAARVMPLSGLSFDVHLKVVDLDGWIGRPQPCS